MPRLLDKVANHAQCLPLIDQWPLWKRRSRHYRYISGLPNMKYSSSHFGKDTAEEF